MRAVNCRFRTSSSYTDNIISMFLLFFFLCRKQNYSEACSLLYSAAVVIKFEMHKKRKKNFSFKLIKTVKL